MAVRVTRAGVALTVGIIILAVLTVGGLLWAKELGEQARREDAIQIANQNLEEQSNNGALNEGDAANEGDQADRAEGAENGQQTEQPSNQPVNGDAQAIPTTGTETPQNASELPQTGPADTLVSILAVALLTFASASYVRSRQHLL